MMHLMRELMWLLVRKGKHLLITMTSGSKSQYYLWRWVFHHCACLKHWQYYLVTKRTGSLRGLKIFDWQQKLNSRHAKWVAYLQQLTFTLKHMVSAQNKVCWCFELKDGIAILCRFIWLGFVIFRKSGRVVWRKPRKSISPTQWCLVQNKMV